MPTVRIADETVMRALATAAESAAEFASGGVLWPVDGDPELPDEITTAQSYLAFTAVELTPDPRQTTNDCEVCQITVEFTVVTVQPETDSAYTNAGLVTKALGVLSEVSLAGADGQTRIELGRAWRKMAAREDLAGRGMATDVRVTGVVKRAAGTGS